MSRTKRTFTAVDPATLTSRMPLAVGLYGYTSTGKTESALRLAHGIVSVLGGTVYFADTDSGRGVHYRSMFPKMQYIRFDPPHNALDFADLLYQFEPLQGVLVIDQMTEEHDGVDGLLDTFAQEQDGKPARNAIAWGVAKTQHKKLVRAFRAVVTKLPIIVTWRAQKKVDWSHKDEKGRTAPESLGDMPVGSSDLPFEMTATYLLPPGAKGVPCLAPVTIGERMMTKIPRFLQDVVREGEALCEQHGEAMARWALGPKPPPPPVELVFPWQVPEIAALATPAELEQMRGAKGKYRDGVPADKAGPVVAGIIATLKGRRTTEQMQQPAGPA